MRLLIITQAVDKNDPILGFFHRWIEEFAKQYDHLHVVCLKKGEYSLPQNVSVHSLGKETRRSRVRYVIRFYHYAWKFRHEYDAVFVHMNQEYILLGGLLWQLLGKRVYLWRNHYAGTFLTDIAAAFCTKVFCTSKHSYTAKYKKTVLMPVGVDTDIFKPAPGVVREPRSVLFFGRISPSKRPGVLLEALGILRTKGFNFAATFCGPGEGTYIGGLKEKVRVFDIAESVVFQDGIPHSEAPHLFSAHKVYVNCSPSGMYDKSILEAAACGCLVLAASSDFAEHVPRELVLETVEPNDCAERIAAALTVTEEEHRDWRIALETLVRQNNLRTLMERLFVGLS
ncbi:hypothetical protein COU20_02390 [Candidatus Kaiserbacteria bacterium CG10_big_fil_rev_8_21_14_0_10_59_10]|uniref:Glycosyltransferase subfamily 4-like N-terminal domain-containing protein n=1 Tax=Candidatus Kaiserbacteria bacterium CG10_big_fil_rev_8_21_14_0_10_59_10 TaxID=1974612 RepID=A0A2H0U7T2_9BACT|nr:MAG: hypothetical protein COU20_02390 [Candidatus Kaiserbacteria bacterium CG10_big_fil_rev_8_21_14_0_10_59_10]